MKPKDWFRQFFLLFYFILFYFNFFIYSFFFDSDSSCEEQEIWLHGYKIPSSDATLGQEYNR